MPSTPRHRATLLQGATREMREADYWLRVIAAAKLDGHEPASTMLNESNQLVAILTVITRNADRSSR